MFIMLFFSISINIIEAGDAYIRHCTESSLVKVKACRLNGTKPLLEMKTYGQFDLQENKFSEILIEITRKK